MDALHTKQEEVQQGQETILSELRNLNGLVSSLGNDSNEVKRQRTTGSTWVAHGEYSTLDTMIAKHPKLGVLLFLCFVLCPGFFFGQNEPHCN